MIISLGRASRCGSSSLPETADRSPGDEQPPRCLCLALLLAGVAWPPTLLRTPVVSYTTFSPSPRASLLSAACFCGPIQQVTPFRALPGAMLVGVRTFLDSALRSRDHPANLG